MNAGCSSKYFFIEVSGKAVCLVCKESIAVFKDYKLSWHFQTKHAEKYRNMSSEQKPSASKELLSQLQKQQRLFTKLHSANDGIVRASYVLSHKIAKHIKPFAEVKFIKECLIDSAAILCPDKEELFENVSLSRRTVTQRVEDITENMEQQLKDKVKDFTYFSLAMDESCDAHDTAQLLIFL